jgi:hypothetical protein
MTGTSTAALAASKYSRYVAGPALYSSIAGKKVIASALKKEADSSIECRSSAS